MSKAVIVENLSKVYRLGEVGTGTISQDLNRWFNINILKKEDPFLQLGEKNDRTKIGESDIVLSLDDINFEVENGDSIGIIGRNGAGKSTLLKVLSRITAPTSGNVRIKGRVSSLLEVGTGFHPDLTGRENIFLNGAILGMRKKEIAKKLDEIIDFSGVERYIDTPVKRYSSGMYVRLAFSVAAHLESELLIIDEVLAVGDAEFQKKCLGKMGDIHKSDGRTVIFVSHNMLSVKSLCNTGLLLTNGKVEAYGNIEDVAKAYQRGSSNRVNYKELDDLGSNKFSLLYIGVKNDGNSYDDFILRNKEIQFEIKYRNATGYQNIFFNLRLKDSDGKYFMITNSLRYKDFINTNEIGVVNMVIPPGYFNEGIIIMDITVQYSGSNEYPVLFHQKDILNFEVTPENRAIGSWMGKEVGYMSPRFVWNKLS